MHINLSAVFMTQYEIPRSGVFKLYCSVALRVQEFTQRGNILLLNGDVQVLVWPGLLAKQRINTPSAIDPDFGAQILKTGVYVDDINRCHLNSLRLSRSTRLNPPCRTNARSCGIRNSRGQLADPRNGRLTIIQLARLELSIGATFGDVNRPRQSKGIH